MHFKSQELTNTHMSQQSWDWVHVRWFGERSWHCHGTSNDPL